METSGLKNQDILSLTVPLPEDIMKLKWCGEFEQAQRVIDQRLTQKLPEDLRRRLMLEKERLRRIPEQYPYSWQDALERMKENIQDFKEEELKRLWEEDAADWIYRHGQVYFRDNFLENIIKTRKEYAERVTASELKENGAKQELLDHTISAMKQNGGQAWRYRMKITITFKREAERENVPVRVYLPLPLEYEQIKEVKLLAVRIGGREARPEEYQSAPPRQGQRTVCIETPHHGGQEYEIEFSFENHETYLDLGASEAVDLAEKSAAGLTVRTEEGEENSSSYLDEELPHIRFTPYLRRLAAEIVGEEKNPLLKARRIYDFITTRVMYSYVRSYLTLDNIPESAAVSLKGDCGVQALLFITLCRISGIPARWQAGLYSAPNEVGNHDWAQVYLSPFGWRGVDCSFGGSAWRSQAKERWNFYFGNLDPFRLPAAGEFQQDFLPPSRHLRNDPYDNQEGEAEYEDAGLWAEEYETRFEMVDAEMI